MIESERPGDSRKNKLGEFIYDAADEKSTKYDGVPSIDRSYRAPKDKGLMSTSKFLLNDEEDDEDDRLSNITELLCDTDENKFRKLYNQ